MSNKSQIAQALAGSPAAFDSQGLQQPAFDPILLLSALAAPAAMGAAGYAPRAMASEAGAVFPEGIPLSQIPKDKATMQEFGSVLTPSQQAYKMNEATSNWHAQNMDWPRVLQDKWALLKNFGGS